MARQAIKAVRRADEDQPNLNLAMPRGPVSRFAQAADFYDSVGINHHPEYLNPGAPLDTAVSRIQELGLRHLRLGMYSPANHGDQSFFQGNSGNMGIKVRDANASRGAGVQPISILWGTTEEPMYEQNRTPAGSSAVYTITNANGTFLRPLDGPSGSVSTTFGPSPINGVAGTRLLNAGTFYNQGWITAGGLQGPNEPDTRTWYANGAGSVREVLRGLKDGKEARVGTDVLAGADYIDSSTGRITAGPANAYQLPVVAPHMVGNNWHILGSYADGADANVGNRHTYWGGHGPNYTELQGQWTSSSSYTGMPRFCTEMGQRVRLPDTGPGTERYVPPEVGGVYNNRSLIYNYLQNVRRTYVYKLSHESAATNPPWIYGVTDVNFARNAAFHTLKNLMTLVGFVEGPSSVNPNITVTGFTAGSTYALGDGYNMPDRLEWIVLQRSATEYLVILVRQRELWNRSTQAYVTVSDPKTVTVTVPNLVSASVAEPEKNSILDPNDGQTYANPGNGTAYAALTPSGNTVSLTVAGLTRVVKVTVS